MSSDQTSLEIVPIKSGRGRYPRTPCKCDICGKQFKSSSARGSHIAAVHRTQANIQISSIAKDGITLSEMLHEISKALEDQKPLVLSPEMVSEIKQQDIRIQTAVRVLAYKRMAALVTNMTNLEKANKALAKRLDDPELFTASPLVLADLVERLQRTIKSDIDTLREVSGLEFNEGVAALLSMIKEAADRASINKPSPFNIPDDPIKREELRKNLLQARVKVAS